MWASAPTKDSSFELTGRWTRRYNTSAISRTQEEAYLGAYSLKLPTTAEEQGAYSQAFTVANGQTVTFSAYVKASTDYTLMLQQEDAVGYYPNHYGQTISGNGQWTRQEVSYTNTSGRTLTMWAFVLSAEAGTIYVDCVQVEIAATASRYNILENGDFSFADSSAVSYYWSGNALDSGDRVVQTTAKAAPNLSGNVLSITGSATADKWVANYVPVSGSAGDCYVVSGWAWADNAVPKSSTMTPAGNNQSAVETTRNFCITVTLHHYDGTSSVSTAEFNTGCNSWQYAAAAVVAEKSYHSAKVTIYYSRNANTVWFDGIQLYKEQFGASYTYDENGNVVSTTDLQGQTTTYEYDSDNNVTAILQNNKAKMTYEYDDYHNVTKATTEEGLVYTFRYDTYGNTDSTSVVSDGKEINSIAHYTNDGNYQTNVWDPLNRITYYGYNPDTGMLDWVRAPGDTTDTETKYSYDELFRPESVTAKTNTGRSLSVTYSYNKSNLETITTAGGVYTFGYGQFGLRTSVGIDGFGTLATYVYSNDRNHNLDRLNYGNDDYVKYQYDEKGRLQQETYTDSDTDRPEDTVRYAYDNSGNLASMTDSATGNTTTYYYDLTDRLMKYVVSDGTSYHSVEYTYDTLNNMTGLKETVDGHTTTTTYTYDKDNRITGMSDGTTSVSYTYDAFGRLEKKETKNGSAVVKTETFVYQLLREDDIYTSSQIKEHKVTVGGTTTTYSYTYDQKGNILTISDGSSTVTYTYDSQSQLLSEKNETTGLDQSWEYNASGNITKRTEGSETINYNYETTGWKDLLKSYNGKTFDYDDVGNPEDDGTWTYTWVHGRQLTSMTHKTTNETWTYTYGADGLRTARTNGTDTWEYVYNGSQLVGMKKGNDTLYFTYDASGAPTTVTHNGTVYYYVTNLQGDVVKIVSATGTVVATYTYDAWGNPISTANTTPSTLESLNPLRYRGYVYDPETGLYYVSSRYYDPEIGRWINADNQLSTGSDLTGMNLFAYCGNNPVNRIDPTGEAWYHWALGAAVVAACAVATVVTCGGFAAAAGAVAAVASGVAAATTASTIAAGAFIGSATVLGTAALIAAGSSTSIEEFNDQGNWGLVVGTVLGALTGGYDGYTMSKAKTPTNTPTNTSRGSTGRTEPANLREQLAMEQVKSNPSAGTQLTRITLNDPRWPSSEGWVKMQQIVPTSQGNINIHYVYNQTLKIFDDFKFKS